MQKKIVTLFIFSSLLLGCGKAKSMNENLPKIEESSLDFTCVTEEQSNGPLDPEADEWFKKARRIEKGEEAGTDAEVINLYKKAIERKHWKAYTNLAMKYVYGEGVSQDTNKAIEILEQGMKLNFSRPYSVMGNFLAEGLGVKRDVAAAYAYGRKAADLGDPNSQTMIGQEFLSAKLNRPELGEKFLQCAISQGEGEAAFAFAARYRHPDWDTFDQAKALTYLQLGVKLGSQESALMLEDVFTADSTNEKPSRTLKLSPDPERAKRYKAIYDKMDKVKGIKFPNIDELVPLPPAKLPPWKGL